LDDAWGHAVNYSAGYVAEPLSHSFHYSDDPLRVKHGCGRQQLDLRPKLDVAGRNPYVDAYDPDVQE